MNRRLLFVLPLLLLGIGCGHTNNLARYKIGGRTAYFRTLVTGSAGSSISVDNPSDHWAGDIAAIVGSIVLSDQASDKLARAINADSIALALGQGVEQSTIDYFDLHPVASLGDGPEYLVETELTEYRLISTAEGISAQVCGTSRIVHRASGAIVWEDSENRTVPLTVTTPSGDGTEARSASSATNATLLLSLEENELRRIINDAALTVGREIGDTLRDDLAELNERD